MGNWKDSEDGGTKQEVSLLLRELLVRKASLLESNFGICISATGNPVEMPELIPGCRLCKVCPPTGADHKTVPSLSSRDSNISIACLSAVEQDGDGIT